MAYRHRILWLIPALVLTGSLALGDEPGFAPGQDTRVEHDGVGGGFFYVSAPEDYDPSKAWPVIVYFHGYGDAVPADPFRRNTQRRGFVIVNMEYFEPRPKQQYTYEEHVEVARREQRAIIAALDTVEAQLSIDRSHMILAGASMGSYLAATISEMDGLAWRGLVLIAGGRPAGVPPPPEVSPEDSENIVAPTIIYIGAGELDPALPMATQTREHYEKLGHDVTFEIYEGLEHQTHPDAEGLHDWLFEHFAKPVSTPEGAGG